MNTNTTDALNSLSVAVLTVVAYKLSFVQTLPALAYTTVFDNFIDFTLVSLFVLGAFTAGVGFYVQYEDQDENSTSFWFNVTGCILYFVSYINMSLVWFYEGCSIQQRKFSERQKKMNQQKENMKKRCQRIARYCWAVITRCCGRSFLTQEPNH